MQPSSRQSSSESLQPSLFGTSLLSGHDDMSLAYSFDDGRSRMSAVTASQQRQHEVLDDDVSAFDGPDHYFTQGYPTIAPLKTPPLPQSVKSNLEPEPETETTPWYQAPLEYIFGGNDNDDDDVSTIHGGFEESFRSERPVQRSFRKTVETIDEGEDESYASYASPVMSEAASRRYLSYKSPEETTEATDSETTYSDSHNKSVSNRGSIRTIGDPSFTTVDPDASIRSTPVDWHQHEKDGLMKTNSQVSRRGYTSSQSSSHSSSQSWRTSRSERQDRRTSLSEGTFRSARTVGSTKSTISALPQNPQVVKFGEGGPMMTMGMSGRAVVHVNVEHDSDGSIHSLYYTTPLVPAEELGYEEVFADSYSMRSMDDETVVIGNKASVPWYEMYFHRNKFLHICYSRKCHRINALVILCSALLVTIGIAVMAILDESTNVTPPISPVRSSDGQRAISLSDLREPPPFHITVPTEIDFHINDWFHKDGNYALSQDDVPYFYHVPLAGALVAADSWGSCLGFIFATDVGKMAQSNDTLKTVQVFGRSYVNVDTTSYEGIAHAQKMNLVPSGLADAIISPLFGEVIQTLYSVKNTAKLIATFRHPVDRAVAMYHYMTTATWAKNYNASLADMTLEEYAHSIYVENNYVTRLLTNKPGGSLTKEDLTMAKEILRRKAVVGLHDNLEESIQHINRYFSWTPTSADATQCLSQVINNGLTKETVSPLDTGSTTYSFLMQQNQFDMNIYEYVRTMLVPYQYEVIARQTSTS